jgi:hypothetical protein
MIFTKQILNLKTQQPLIKQFPTEEEKKEGIKYETIGDVILNSLNHYSGENRLDGFYANSLAQLIINSKENEEIELKEKYKSYLKKIFDKSIIQVIKNKDGNTAVMGIYPAYIISQVLLEVLTEEEIEKL